MRNFRILAVAGFFLLAFQPPAWASVEEGKANAAELVGGAQKAIGQLVRYAQADPALKSDKPESKPFWSATKSLNETLGKAQTGLVLKDQTFFTNLAGARAHAAQASIAVTMAGSQDDNVRRAMGTVSRLVNTLDDTYSKETASLKSDAKLTADERKQLEKLQGQQRELLKKLDQVEKNVAKNNKEMKAGIDQIRAESKKISKARKTRAGFVSGFMAARVMSSWMWGWHWWWGPWGAWCPGWIDINIIIWDDWIDAVPYDWALADEFVELGALDYGMLDISDAELAEADAWLEGSDFSLSDGDLEAFTSSLDLGWDDIDPGRGGEIMDQYEQNWDDAPFEDSWDANTFDDMGMDDFGGGFDDFGGDMDFDW